MRAYIDSSIVLGHILAGDPTLGAIRADVAGSSELLQIECHRVLHRERMSGHLDDTRYAYAVELLESVADRLAIMEMGPAVKRRAAGPFPTLIGTLDAIHLATALLWQEAEPASAVRIVTKDRQLALCAKAMGFKVDTDRG